MKKQTLFFIAVILLFPILLLSCQRRSENEEVVFDGYKTLSVQKSSYPTYDTEYSWRSLFKKNAKLRLYYKTEMYQETEYISHLFYVLESGGKKSVLGSFKRETGFLGADGEELEHERIWYLQGLSMKTLENPFFVTALYVQCETGWLYEKNGFINLCFDSKNKTLAKCSPR